MRLCRYPSCAGTGTRAETHAAHPYRVGVSVIEAGATWRHSGNVPAGDAEESRVVVGRLAMGGIPSPRPLRVRCIGMTAFCGHAPTPLCVPLCPLWYVLLDASASVCRACPLHAAWTHSHASLRVNVDDAESTPHRVIPNRRSQRERCEESLALGRYACSRHRNDDLAAGKRRRSSVPSVVRIARCERFCVRGMSSLPAG